MKILVVTAAYQKYEKDNVTDFMLNFSKSLQALGHEVRVVAAHYPGLPKREVFSGITVDRFAYFYPKKYERLAYGSGIVYNMRKSFLAKLQLLPYMIAGALKVRSVVKEFKPDVVHALWAFPQGFMCAFMKGLMKFNLSVNVIGTEAYLAKRYRLPFLISYPTNRADIVTSVSSTTTAAAKACGMKAEPHLIFNGADDKTFNPGNSGAGVIKEFSLKGCPVVLAIGRMVERKGFNYLIESIEQVRKKFPKVRLMLVGDGPQEQELKDLTARLGLDGNVVFSGRRGHDELSSFYAATDIFVIPSIVDSRGVAEGGQGLVTKEAMLTKRPVIGTNTGGIPDLVIDNKTGLLVEEKNPKELADAIIKLLSNPKLRSRLAEDGYKVAVERATWKNIAKNYEKLYSELLEKKKSGVKAKKK